MSIFPYIFLLIIPFFGINNKKFNIPINFLLYSTVFIILVTLRSSNVGWDTESYIDIFETYSQLNLSDILLLPREFAFYILVFLLSKFGLSYIGLFFFQSVIYIFALHKLITTFFNKISPSFLIISTVYITIYAFSAVRQSFALSFLILSFIALHENRVIKAIFLYLAAILFHISSIIFLLVIVIKVFSFSKVKIFFISFILGLLIYMGVKTNYFTDLFFIISGFDYSEGARSDGEMYFLYRVVIIIAFIINYKKIIKINPNNNTLLFITLAPLIFYPLLKITPTMFRVISYFNIFDIVIIPLIIYSFSQNNLIRNILFLIFLAPLIYVYIIKTLPNGHFIPYNFIN